MKVDVENLISIIEENYPPIKKSGYWQDLIKLIPKDGQASQSGQDREGIKELCLALKDAISIIEDNREQLWLNGVEWENVNYCKDILKKFSK